MVWILFYRYKEYATTKACRIEVLQAVIEKLNENERFNKIHEVQTSACIDLSDEYINCCAT